MAAKLLYSLTDGNPDLQTEMGYINGIFQRFDRQNIVPGRRSVSEQIPPRHTSGNPLFGHCLNLFCCLLYLYGSCSSIVWFAI